MNIIHFTHGKVNPEGGSGISRVVYALNKHEKLLGHNSKILSVVDGVKKHETYKRDEFVTVEMFPRIGFFTKHNPIFDYIKANSENIDIVHIHHMWFYDKNPVIDLCGKLNIPTVMTLHDNYNKYMFGWKKKIAWLIYEGKYSKKVTAYRALCKEELNRIRNLKINLPVFVNYNGIECNEKINNEIPKPISENKGKIILVNISRINKRKNQLEIVKAVNLLPKQIKEGILLLLIGTGNKTYLEEIETYIIENNLTQNAKLLGPIYGEEKWVYINNCDGYIHCSHTDVISLSVLEAVCAGKPCIISRSCKVSYLYKYNFFIMCEPYADDIARAITEFCEHKEKHEQMGENALAFAKKELSHEAVTGRMLEIYSKVINNERF